MSRTDEDPTDEGRPNESGEQAETTAEFGRDPDKPMSQEQQAYLKPLAESQDEKVRDDMSEADAAVTIDRLQENAVHIY
jgi:hypothetical protein